jgi:hypothetical protein
MSLKCVQGGVYLLYLHSFAFRYRYILYTLSNAQHVLLELPIWLVVLKNSG